MINRYLICSFPTSYLNCLYIYLCFRSHLIRGFWDCDIRIKIWRVFCHFFVELINLICRLIEVYLHNYNYSCNVSSIHESKPIFWPSYRESIKMIFSMSEASKTNTYRSVDWFPFISSLVQWITEVDSNILWAMKCRFPFKMSSKQPHRHNRSTIINTTDNKSRLK